jgi:hypothetical protein
MRFSLIKLYHKWQKDSSGRAVGGLSTQTRILVWTLKLKERTRSLSIVTIEGMPKTHQVVVEVNIFFNFLVLGFSV